MRRQGGPLSPAPTTQRAALFSVALVGAVSALTDQRWEVLPPALLALLAGGAPRLPEAAPLALLAFGAIFNLLEPLVAVLLVGVSGPNRFARWLWLVLVPLPLIWPVAGAATEVTLHLTALLLAAQLSAEVVAEAGRGQQAAEAAWEKARRLRREVQDAAREHALFLSSLDRTLRAPLQRVVLALETLAHRAVPAVAEPLGWALASAATLRHLLEEGLEQNRRVTGQALPLQIPFSPSNLARSVVEPLRPRAQAGGVALTLAIEPETPAQLVGDQHRIRQILSNLLSNALRFTPAGGRVVVTLRGGPQTWSIEVQDTGTGIAPEVLTRLSAPFEQGGASVAREHGGTGLGLGICRDLTMFLGGQLRLHSVPDEGTRVEVQLPLRQRHPTTEGEAQSLLPLPATLRIIGFSATDSRLWSARLAQEGIRIVEEGAEATLAGPHAPRGTSLEGRVVVWTDAPHRLRPGRTTLLAPVDTAEVLAALRGLTRLPAGPGPERAGRAEPSRNPFTPGGLWLQSFGLLTLLGLLANLTDPDPLTLGLTSTCALTLAGLWVAHFQGRLTDRGAARGLAALISLAILAFGATLGPRSSALHLGAAAVVGVALLDTVRASWVASAAAAVAVVAAGQFPSGPPPTLADRAMIALIVALPGHALLRLLRDYAAAWQERRLALDQATADEQAAAQEAQAVQNRRALLGGSLTHELRGPLQGILGTTQLLAQHPWTNEQQELWNRIEEEAHFLLRTTDAVLDWARLEAGRMALVDEDVDLQALFTDLARRPETRKNLLLQGLERLPPRTVRTDGHRLRQLLDLTIHQLLQTAEGPVQLRVDAEWDGESYALTLDLTAAKPAAGVTPAPGGTGLADLNLRLAFHLASRLGGHLEVEPDRAQLSLDLEPAEVTEARRRLQGATVLLLEDDPIARRLLERRLAQSGCACLAVGRVAEALALDPSAFGFAVLDGQLPDGDGLEVARALRARGFKGPIVLVTADDDWSRTEALRAAGADAVLGKPVPTGRLEDALARGNLPGRGEPAPAGAPSR